MPLLVLVLVLNRDNAFVTSAGGFLRRCRQAIVDALSNAPSIWALGNAGVGALQVHLEQFLEWKLPDFWLHAQKIL